jgi:hypothetical protein
MPNNLSADGANRRAVALRGMRAKLVREGQIRKIKGYEDKGKFPNYFFGIKNFFPKLINILLYLICWNSKLIYNHIHWIG